MNAKIKNRQRGFTLTEFLIAMLAMTVITGVIFQQVNVAQVRSATEQSKLDTFQETREFMDQLTRDLHQAGYPNIHNFAPNTINVNNLGRPVDERVGVGLVKLDYNYLMFEGDVDGTGQVSSILYDVSSTGDGCPCIRRSQLNKQSRTVSDPTIPDPMNPGTPQYWTEVQGLQNGTTTAPIFAAYDTHNQPITLPVNYDHDSDKIATISTIKVVITAQAPKADLKTRVRPSATLASTIKINNCSAAAPGDTMSCQ